jgi:SPP1 gp7 family putative phage head morphogenesis protein
MAKVYLEAYKQVEKDLAEFLGRFGDIDEAQKYNRLAGLKATIAEQLKGLSKESIKLCTESSEFSFSNAFQSTWFNMEQSIGESLEFGILNLDAIRASVFSEYSGAAFPYRFGKLYTSTVDQVAEAITRGLIQGTGYRETAKQIKDIFEGSFNNAMRVIRTESTRNLTEGDLEAYDRAEKSGIEGVKTWLSTFDGRTRDSHARLNGKEADSKGFFNADGNKTQGPGLWGVASEDIQCRCTTYYKLKGYEKDYAPDWQYETWKKRYGFLKEKSPLVSHAT